MLANYQEMMAFAKSGWHITEITTDPTTGGQTIYAGRCAAPGCPTAAPAWCIKRTTITVTSGTQTVTEMYADGDTLPDNVWDDRHTLNYLFII